MTTPGLIAGLTSEFEPGFKRSLAGLLAPLQQLDRCLQQTIEVTHLLHGTAFERYLISGMLAAAQPGQAVVAGSSLAALQAAFGLSEFEVGVVVMAIAPELDRRYERLYADIQNHAWFKSVLTNAAYASRKPSVALALHLLCPDDAARTAQLSHFATASPLIHGGLIQSLNPHENLLSQPLQISPIVSRYLLGQQKSLDPQLVTYCQMSWPKAMPLLPDSPLLSSLIKRLQSGSVPLPLSLGFVGMGNKKMAAEAIAATLQVPLLRINLVELANGLSASEPSRQKVGQKVGPILLQAQLLNAVLYLEDVANWPASRHCSMLKFIHPNLIEAFCEQMASYVGVTIFTSFVPSLPQANGAKGTIVVPFVQPQTSIQPQLPSSTKAQRALNEIEKFRQRLMRSSMDVYGESYGM